MLRWEEIKDPDAVLDYAIDWSDWLDGDTITSSTWTVPPGLTNDEDENSYTDTGTVIWLSGGTAGQRYEITNRITTANGRTNDRTIRLYVKDR